MHRSSLLRMDIEFQITTIPLFIYTLGNVFWISLLCTHVTKPASRESFRWVSFCDEMRFWSNRIPPFMTYNNNVPFVCLLPVCFLMSPNRCYYLYMYVWVSVSVGVGASMLYVCLHTLFTLNFFCSHVSLSHSWFASFICYSFFLPHPPVFI